VEGERLRRGEVEERLRVAEGARSDLVRSLAAAETEARQAERQIEAQKEFLESSRQELENAFKALAAGVLEGSAKQFLHLADERFARSRAEAGAELEQRKQAIQGLVEPLKEVLGKLESRTAELERARVDAYAKIDKQIDQLVAQTIRLQDKTTTLQTALRSSQVRGRWGEIALRNIAELSGMTEHCDFFEQQTLPGGSRPDMIVRLPGDRYIAVDAKTPLNAYLSALEAATEAEREAALDQHVSDLRGHLKALAARDYARSLDGELDLVVMFLPGDPYVAAAFAREPELLTEALRSKVLIATPTTLIALLRTMAIYWQQRSVAENAEQIAAVARTLYERATVFAEHLGRMGKGLRSAVDSYNQAVASFERRLLPMGQKLEELKVTEQVKRRLQDPEVLEEGPRKISAPESPEPGTARDRAQ
jgi:DNA recombination protein RmuC